MPIQDSAIRPAGHARAARLSGPIALAMVAAFLSGCSSLGGSGPSSRTIANAAKPGSELAADIKVVELTDAVARQVLASRESSLLSEVFGDGEAYDSIIEPGDVLDVAIWEAPPAALFGSASTDARITSTSTTSRGSNLPEQMVDSAGRITVPFAGSIQVAGLTPQQVGREISRRLDGIAHQPQTIVRLVRNAAANVTVVGEVASSVRVPLTPKGERLLEILASAGGVRQPVGKTTIQVSRGGKVAAMPLDQIIREPAQNIRMQSNDVVTALYQPFSFTSLGAVGNNAEISFEGTGITLAQALGRVGGLRDERADVRGVFIFRLEDPAALDPELVRGARLTPDGKIPVIYRVDLKSPTGFFVAQGFPIHNRDVLYVSNAPVADLQKFVNIVSSMAFSVAGVANSL